jgi:Domain of unknown function (DUF4382)
MNRFNSYSRRLTWITTIMLAALVAGCGGGGGSAAAGASSGTLGVSLTDAPACGFDAVNVTVSKVRVHQSASANENAAGWTDITLNPARKINLLNFTNGALEDLGQTPLTPGHYTQLRLVLDPNTGLGTANSVVPSGTTTEIPLITPSAVQNGIKLINEFDVVAGQRVDLVLDFNACKSIVKHGNGSYALKPVVKVIPFALNGIDGFVDPALIGNNVMVSAQQDGTIISSTAPNTTTGEFFLARLAPGNYDVVVTANDHATAVVASVPVATTTSVTVLSTDVAPLTLPTSSTHNLGGTVTLTPSSTDPAYVAAKQTFGAAPTVTVGSQAADLLSGAYALTLPIEAPLLGSYTSPPIAFAAQSAVAAQYTAEASSTGYATQSVSTDISAGDATHDFTLVP